MEKRVLCWILIIGEILLVDFFADAAGGAVHGIANIAQSRREVKPASDNDSIGAGHGHDEWPSHRWLAAGNNMRDVALNRVFVYGDAFVAGECGFQCKSPIAPILESYLVDSWPSSQADDDSPQVSYFTNGPMWTSLLFFSRLKSDRLGLVQHLKRVGAQVVVIWAGYFDVITSDPVESFSSTLVVDALEGLAEAALHERDVRHVVILGVPITPSGYTADDPAQQQSQINLLNAELGVYASTKRRVHFVPMPDVIYTPPDDVFGLSPYFSGGGANRLSQLGYQTVVTEALGPFVLSLLQSPLRVLCYGDSLTWGTPRSPDPNPYNGWMEPRLQDFYGLNLVSKLFAIPGIRATFMWNATNLDAEPHSLRHQLELKGGAHDLVIILLGTNDLRASIDWVEINVALQQLHRVALEEEEVRFTIAVDMPGSQMENDNPNTYGFSHQQIARLLSQRPDTRITWVPFPFEFIRNGTLWAEEIHPNAAGYKILGEYLADKVFEILTQNRRIFCYGDDWITGITPGTVITTPFCEDLEDALLGNSGTGYDVVVSHHGIPGGTVSDVLALEASSDRFSLTQLLSTGYPEMDIVIIMVGTFDMLESDPDPIVIANSIIDLHERALTELGANHTIMIGVPQSEAASPQNFANGLLETLVGVNSDLEFWAQSEPRTTWIPFPYTYDEEGNNAALWADDGIHATPQGYQELLSVVDPVVRTILDSPFASTNAPAVPTSTTSPPASTPTPAVSDPPINVPLVSEDFPTPSPNTALPATTAPTAQPIDVSVDTLAPAIENPPTSNTGAPPSAGEAMGIRPIALGYLIPAVLLLFGHELLP